MSLTEHRLGDCEVCGSTFAKYTCPKCEVKTCNLKCVNIHKKELKCDGIRDKTKFVPLSKFTNLDLLSDYRLLEDANRTVESLKKDKSKRHTRFNRDLPRHLFLLKKELANRQTTIKFLPANFSKHKSNSTYLNFKTKKVIWQIEWVFVQAENLKIIQEKCEENLKLSHLLYNYLNPNKYKNDRLKFYQSTDLNGLNLFLKAENKPGSKYYNLDSSLSLKEILKNKTIIEYPTILVTFKDHIHSFETIDSDDEVISDPSNPVKYVSEIVKADNEQNTVKKGSLLFVSEYSDSELISSDENL